MSLQDIKMGEISEDNIFSGNADSKHVCWSNEPIEWTARKPNLNPTLALFSFVSN